MLKTHDQFTPVNKEVSFHTFPSDFVPRLRPLSFAVVLAFAQGAATAATITVNSNSPNSNVAGLCTLRDAVVSANTGTVPAGSTCIAGAGGDTIDFDPASFTGGAANIITFTAPLAGAIDALRVNRTLTIDASSVGGVTLERSSGIGTPDFRVINVFDPASLPYATAIELTLAHVTISGGKTTADNTNLDASASDFTVGAGISTKGPLTLIDSIVTNNSTTGNLAFGGGVYAFDSVTLNNSTVSNNSTSGFNAIGGGLAVYASVTLNNSTVSNNSTTGDYSVGGGLAAYTVTLNESTVSNNSTTGVISYGGGIYAYDSVTLNNSTVSNNSTSGDYATGGGIDAYLVTLNDSTVSNNSTAGQYASGGGFFSYNSVRLYNSTISGNSTSGTGANGGGIFIAQPDSIYTPFLILLSTLITNNSVGPGGQGEAIAYPFATGIVATGDHNLVTGSVYNVTLPPANLITSCANPLLNPLANNGGPTQTHALPTGSCAINAGSNPNSFTYDQRGSGFARVIGGAADIGAFEVQPPPVNLSIIKTITGGNATINDKFSFTADCGAAGTFLGDVFLSTALFGSGSILAIPDGSSCTVAEDSIFPTPPVGFNWGSLPAAVGPLTVNSAISPVSFTNTLQSGSLTINKTVTMALPTAGSFNFTLNCTHPTAGVTAYGGTNPQSISIAAGGATGSVTVNPIAAGSTCSVTETAPTAIANYSWGSTPAPVTGITISNGGTAIAAFNNTLTQNPIPTPTITRQPTAIPTLSEWTQIALGFMLSIAALIRLRKTKAV